MEPFVVLSTGIIENVDRTGRAWVRGDREEPISGSGLCRSWAGRGRAGRSLRWWRWGKAAWRWRRRLLQARRTCALPDPQGTTPLRAGDAAPNEVAVAPILCHYAACLLIGFNSEVEPSHSGPLGQDISLAPQIGQPLMKIINSVNESFWTKGGPNDAYQMKAHVASRQAWCRCRNPGEILGEGRGSPATVTPNWECHLNKHLILLFSSVLHPYGRRRSTWPGGAAAVKIWGKVRWWPTRGWYERSWGARMRPELMRKRDGE